MKVGELRDRAREEGVSAPSGKRKEELVEAISAAIAAPEMVRAGPPARVLAHRVTPGRTWEDWFETFDARRLNFIYQEERSDGRPSTFFRLESPDREDA